MQGWSWMAALTLVAAVAGAPAPSAHAAEPTPVKQKVKLSLRLDNVSNDCEVSIKPGNPGCKFEPVKFKVSDKPADSRNIINLAAMDVETVTADRSCMFAITMKDLGKPEKTVHRYLKIVPDVEGKPAAPQSLRCYISAESLPVAEAPKSDDPKQKK